MDVQWLDLMNLKMLIFSSQAFAWFSDLLVEHAEIFWSLFAVDMDSTLEMQPPDTWDSFPLFQLLNDYLRNDGMYGKGMSKWHICNSRCTGDAEKDINYLVKFWQRKRKLLMLMITLTLSKLCFHKEYKIKIKKKINANVPVIDAVVDRWFIPKKPGWKILV